ncbi:KAP family P-loop NTPase fold protein [Ralstonia pseudosolanacearum]|uniref:KAP family P-loop NTPase fold protein n=1 Tax=Ralstonia pseudosolanacearum TaxID=1310165 RepID=UPI003AAB4A84
MTQTTHPLSLPSDRWDTLAEPFKGDMLERQKLAQRLTGYLGRLRDGAVIAIDAPWGEGKTWFTQHWAAQLRKDGHAVGMIDAFQQDYVEDPFMLVAGEILRLCATNKTMVAKLRERAGSVMSAILPVAVKATINVAARALGTTDLVDEFSEAAKEAVKSGTGKAADVAKVWVEKKLAAHESDKHSLRAFREALAEYAAAQPEPVVILVDELDRCRPAFAVRLIERIKHFFDVPNLVFVLVMNREQLEKAVKGVYGAETDAATYLSKFLQLSLTLPKERSWNVDDVGHRLKQFTSAAWRQFKYTSADDSLAYTITVWALVFELSLRDIERVCALYFLSDLHWPGVVTFLAAAKLRRPDLFDGFRRNESQAYGHAVSVVQGAIASVTTSKRPFDSLTRCLSATRDFLNMVQSPPALGEQYVEAGRYFLFGDQQPRMSDVQAFHAAVKALDLDVQ